MLSYTIEATEISGYYIVFEVDREVIPRIGESITFDYKGIFHSGTVTDIQHNYNTDSKDEEIVVSADVSKEE